MSFLFLPGRGEGSTDLFSSGGAPSAPSRSTPTDVMSSEPASAMESSSPSRSTTMSEPSTETRGEDELTLFPRGFPVPPSPSPGKGSPGKTRGTSGRKRLAFYAKYDRDSHFWRTSQDSSGSMDTSERYSGTWPKQGSMRSGCALERPTSAPLTDDTASGFWPTIRRTDGDRGGRGDLIQAARGNPNSHYKLYPTPSRQTYGTNQGGAAGRIGTVRASLETMARHNLWPTKNDSNGDHSKIALKLPGAILPPDERATLGRETPRKNRPTLNPSWVEWLQGFPISATSLQPLEMHKFLSAWLAPFRSWLAELGEND